MNFKHFKGKIRFVSPIAYFSNIMAVILFYSAVFVTALFNMPSMVDMMIPIFCIFSIAIQTYFFKVRCLQESQWVDKKWLKKTHKFTFDQLNKYSRFNYKFFTFIKLVIGSLALLFQDISQENLHSFVGAVIFGSFILRTWLGRQGVIPYPPGPLKFTNPKTSMPVQIPYLDKGQLANGKTFIRWKNM